MSLESIELRPWEEEFTLPDQFNMVSLLLERHLKPESTRKTAILSDDDVISYGRLGELTNRTGNGLSELGVGPTDRVILLLHDSPVFAAAFLGAMKIGAVPVPINVMATSHDLAYFINDSEASVVVAEEDLAGKVVPIMGECPRLKRLVVNADQAGEHVSYHEMLRSASPELSVYPTSKNDHSYWLYTSGTTGQPKGVMHQHKDLVYAVETWGRHVVDFHSDETVYCVSRLFFSYGLNYGLYLPLYYGAAVVLSPGRPVPEKVVENVVRYRPNLLFSVPTSYGQILNYLDEKNLEPDFSSLRACMSAGEALPGPLYDRWLKRFGVEILDGLGSSEVSYIYISNVPGKVRKSSFGRVLPGYKARVLDDDGKEQPVGEVGNLWVKSNTLAEGYWNKPEKTREAFQDGWMKTGDRCWVDEDGYFFYAGRSDDALKVSGIWVSPLEVEETLLEHGSVAECAVVAHRDQMGLIKPKAFVTLKSGFEPKEELAAELQVFVKQRLAPYKYPRWIEFVSELPKTATGKIQRYKLRQQGENEA